VLTVTFIDCLNNLADQEAGQPLLTVVWLIRNLKTFSRETGVAKLAEASIAVVKDCPDDAAGSAATVPSESVLSPEEMYRAAAPMIMLRT